MSTIAIFDDVAAYDDDAFAAAFDAYAAKRAGVVEDDEMDAPSDWDAGSVIFDPYV